MATVHLEFICGGYGIRICIFHRAAKKTDAFSWWVSLHLHIYYVILSGCLSKTWNCMLIVYPVFLIQSSSIFLSDLKHKIIDYIFFWTFHCPMFQLKVSFLTLSGRIWNSRRWFFRSVKTWLKETAPRVIISVTLLARKSDILASQHLGYIDCRGKRVELFHLCFCLFRVHVKHNNWSLCT